MGAIIGWIILGSIIGAVAVIVIVVSILRWFSDEYGR